MPHSRKRGVRSLGEDEGRLNPREVSSKGIVKLKSYRRGDPRGSSWKEGSDTERNLGVAGV